MGELFKDCVPLCCRCGVHVSDSDEFGYFDGVARGNEREFHIGESWKKKFGEQVGVWINFQAAFGSRWWLWPIPCQSAQPPNYSEPLLSKQDWEELLKRKPALILQIHVLAAGDRRVQVSCYNTAGEEVVVLEVGDEATVALFKEMILQQVVSLAQNELVLLLPDGRNLTDADDQSQIGSFLP